MKKLFSILFTVVLAGVFAACRTQDVASQALTVTTWNIVEVNGKAVADVDKQPCITFGADGRYYGNASVNNFFGEYTLKGNGLQLSEGGMTRMMGRSMEVEDQIVRTFPEVRKFSVNGNQATICDGNGKALLKLQKAAQ